MAKFTITDKNLPKLEEFYSRGEYIWGNLQDVYKFIFDELEMREDEIELRSKAFAWIAALGEVISHVKYFDPYKEDRL